MCCDGCGLYCEGYVSVVAGGGSGVMRSVNGGGACDQRTPASPLRPVVAGGLQILCGVVCSQTEC